MGSDVETRSADSADATAGETLAIQPCGFLVELSADWIVRRASENCDRLLGESHVTLVGEPIGRFIQAEPLHDLRNLFSRISGSTGVARTFRVRLTDDRPRFDIAFQQSGSRVLLEGLPSPHQGLGDSLGAIAGLAAGLERADGNSLLESAARRMRALTGFDRVTFIAGRRKATSSRSGVIFPPGANASLSAGLPAMVADAGAVPIPVYPRQSGPWAATPVLAAPTAGQAAELRERRIVSAMRIPVALDGRRIGEFRCAHMTARKPNFELQAAAELFAQMVALRMEMERLRG